MSNVETVLHKAFEEGIYHETMSFAIDIKKENPKIETNDRYELAYKKAKQLKASPNTP
jgi:hypothetical protein